MPGSRAVIQGRIANMDVVPLHAPMGAEIRGLDLTRLDQHTFAVLKRTLLDHLLVLVRGQTLAEGDLVALAEHFGTVDAGHGAPESENVWHSEWSALETPVSVCAAYAAQMPAPHEAPSMEFCNTYAAYDALPNRLGRRVHGMTIRHATAAHSVDELPMTSGASHPIVYTHPETGCNALFLGRQDGRKVNGLSVKASDTLLDELWQHTTQPQFRMAHDWRAGDVIVWDNRCTLHRCPVTPGAERCVVHAALVRGERPIEAPDAGDRAGHPRAFLFAGAG